MIKVDNVAIWGFKHAIRGMRNPLNSWDKSDSYFEDDIDVNSKAFSLGENDLDLMKRLFNAGPEYRKYLRQIFVSMDITAPLYWWKEFDTYKVGTVANSCSTMHKIAAKEFELDDFSHEHLEPLYFQDGNIACDGYDFKQNLKDTIRNLNMARKMYNETKDKRYWWQMIQLLPTSYNQKRTVTMNYENVITMINQRTNHKLDEWNDFVAILKDFRYVKELMEE